MAEYVNLEISPLLDAPPVIRSAVKRVRYRIPPGGFIAGGWLRDAVACCEPKDVDYFFTTPESYYTTSRDLGRRGARFLYATRNAVGLEFEGDRIELVSVCFDDVITCLCRFDFIANCVAVTADGRYIRHPEFEQDALIRRLRVLNPTGAQDDKVGRMQARGWNFEGDRALLKPAAWGLYGC